ncbi:hypothetical protein PV11_00793 [Exophiala sideris]|uniref:Uncharacterized protein n=1 Tax=Exophiala sideris TaxID=1016849 RepID=A0A0D1YQP5_9EURO|nr:hypothetical protein PV11_00793 [Exophiala sideris]
MHFSTGFLAAALLQLVNAAPAPSASATALSCTNSASNGQTYDGFVVQCGIDYIGGDIGMAWTSTFESCIDTCAATSGCIDVSYVGGACYMKNAIGNGYNTNSVWGAKKATTTTTAALSCPTANGQSYDGFTIACGIDYWGGDLSSLWSGTLEGKATPLSLVPQILPL